LIVLTPMAAFALKSKRDPEGFRKDVEGALPAAVAAKVNAAFLPPRPPPPPPPVEAVKKVEEPPPIDPQVVADAQKAAEEQAKLVAEAAALAAAQLAAAAEAERQRRAEVEAKLEEELWRLAKERELLEKAIAGMREELKGAEEAAKMPPQIIFQEHQLSDALRERLDHLHAGSVADKVIDHLQKRAVPDPAVVVDTAKEPALKESATLEDVQGRIKDLLGELESRTRLEAMKVREVVKQTEEACLHDLTQALVSQLAAQEKELQRLLDIQVAEVNRVCLAEVKRRDASYQETMLTEWDAVNKRAEEYAKTTIRMLEIKRFVERQELMKQEREDLAAKFSTKANERIAHIEDLRLRVSAVDKVLGEGEDLAQRHATLVSLHFTVEEAAKALDEGKGLAPHIALLHTAAASSPLLQAAVDSLPAVELVASKASLAASLQAPLFAARKALIIPPDGGMVWEAWAAVRGAVMRPFRDETLPQGFSNEAHLRRACYYINKGDEAAAVEELGRLDSQPAKAVRGWVEEARRRLVVRQALDLVRAHVTTAATNLV